MLGEIIRQAATKKSVLFETRLLRKDGTSFPVESSGHLVTYEGKMIWISYIRDITDRKMVVDALKELSAYNRSLIEASLDPLVTISPGGKIQDVNAATENVTGYPRDKLIGTDFSDYFTEPERAREGYHRVFSEGNVLDYLLEIRHSDGHITPVLYNATVYRDPDGNVLGVFAAARDIAERKKAEEQREILIRELAQKNAELDRFTYTVSHDLKGPLLSIRAFLDVLEDDLKSGDSGRAMKDIAMASESAEKLERLIATLLDLSRSGRIVDVPVPDPLYGSGPRSSRTAGRLPAPTQRDAGNPGQPPQSPR